MSKVLNDLQNKFFSQYFMAEVDELNFFFEQYKPQNEEERNLIKGVRFNYLFIFSYS